MTSQSCVIADLDRAAIGIIMTKVGEAYSEWKPDLGLEALAHMAQLRALIEPRIKLMREIRKGLGLTQVEVAHLLGMTQANVSKIENRGDPSLSVLARMAEAKGKQLRLTVESEDGEIEKSFAVG